MSGRQAVTATSALGHRLSHGYVLHTPHIPSLLHACLAAGTKLACQLGQMPGTPKPEMDTPAPGDRAGCFAWGIARGQCTADQLATMPDVSADKVSTRSSGKPLSLTGPRPGASQTVASRLGK